MKIINKYILKEHVGPFVFALSALTSLLLLQYIARRFGDLVGRGLPWQVITEFLLLSVPLTLALTVPMAVLVSVLYAYSRLASENEITALKAGGVSSRSLMWPAVWVGSLLALLMLAFNDQALPRANHELATLQVAILQKKPTFALRPQVINTVKEGQLYLRAGAIDQNSDRMRDVVIYDVSDPSKRRTIYADSGTLAFAQNRRDIDMRLYSGMMMSSPTANVGQLTRIYYQRDEMKIRDVANELQSINADTTSKGDREMSVCEMQQHYERANIRVEVAKNDSVLAVWRLSTKPATENPKPNVATPAKIGGIGAMYCTFITKYLKVQTARAAEVQQPQQPRDTTKKKAIQRIPPQHPNSVYVVVGSQFVRVPWDKIPPDAYYPGGVPAGVDAIRRAEAAKAAGAGGTRMGGIPGAPIVRAEPPVAPSAGAAPESTKTPAAAPVVTATPEPHVGIPPEIADAKARLDDARRMRNRFAIEIQKKFSLAAACIVFVLVGAPVALRFPRGGVGLVIGASFFVFAVYYVALTSGESLANKNLVSPFWAMWLDNIIFIIVGGLLLTRMGREGMTNRGSKISEMIDDFRERMARRRIARGRG